MPYPNGATSLGQFLSELPEFVKVIGALVAILAVLAGIMDYPDVRSQVEENTQEIRQIEEYMGIQDRRWERVLCHLEEQRKERPVWERCES